LTLVIRLSAWYSYVFYFLLISIARLKNAILIMLGR